MAAYTIKQPFEHSGVKFRKGETYEFEDKPEGFIKHWMEKEKMGVEAEPGTEAKPDPRFLTEAQRKGARPVMHKTSGEGDDAQSGDDQNQTGDDQSQDKSGDDKSADDKSKTGKRKPGGSDDLDDETKESVEATRRSRPQGEDSLGAAAASDRPTPAGDPNPPTGGITETVVTGPGANPASTVQGSGAAARRASRP